MRTDARTRAERCFALARSTTFSAERATAIERGVRIAKDAGLDLAGLDIPGRDRPAAHPKGQRAPDRYTAAEISDLMSRFRAHMAAAERRQPPSDVAAALDRLKATMAAQAAAAGAAADETIHDARLRNFHHAAAEARARDAQREAA